MEILRREGKKRNKKWKISAPLNDESRNQQANYSVGE